MIFLLKKNIKRFRALLRSVFSGRQNLKTAVTRILMYHSIGGNPSDHHLAVRVKENSFKSQIAEIVNSGYQVFTLTELIEKNVLNFDGKNITITFDDGYKDNMKAASILRENGLKATFFITTSFLEGKVKKYWSDGVQRQYMNWEDIVNLVNMDFEIGSHMLEHVDLTVLGEKELLSQFVISRRIIAEHTGFLPKVFSYPYGKFNTRVVEAAEKAGYIGGCSSVIGLNSEKSNIYALKRTEIDGYDTISDFKMKLEGWYD